MKISVVGSTGFIGSAVYERLIEKGHNPRPIATSSKGRRLDLSAEWLKDELAGSEIVYLAAGRTGGVGRMANDPMSFIYPNVRIHMNVFEACQAVGVKRIICGQSITGYPDTPDPVREEQYHTGHLHPAYFIPGNTWRFIDNVASMFKGLEVVFVRPSNVYGPRNDFDPQTSHVIEATVRKVHERQSPFVIWGNGKDLRDPTYIGDLAEAMSLCIDCPPGAYNIGTGDSVSVNDMVRILCELVGFKPKIEYDLSKPTAIQTRYLDITKAKSVLGWEPMVPIRYGLKRTYEYYAQYADRAAA